MKFILSFLLLFTYTSIDAQDSTTWTKNAFGFELFGNNPRLNGLYNTKIYKYRGGALKETKEYLNYGAALTYLRNKNRQFSYGIELNTRVFRSPSPRFDTIQFGPNTSFIDSDTIFLKMEALRFSQRGALIKFEFHKTKPNGTPGFTHGIGIGYSETQLSKTNYRYTLNEVDENNTEYESEMDTYIIDEAWPKFRSVTAQYSLHKRYPIHKQLMFDTGLKVLLNLFINPSEETFASIQSDPFNYRVTFYDVQRKNFFSLSAKIGLVYLL